MPAPSDPVLQALRQWILTTTGLPDNKVILAYLDGDQPEWPYVTIDPYFQVRPTNPYEDEIIQGDGDTATHIHRDVLTCAVNSYGDVRIGDGLAAAQAAYHGVASPAIRDALNTAGLGLIDRGHLEHLNFVMETKFCERYQFDVTFNLVTTTTEAIPAMAETSLTGTLVAPDGSTIVITDTITP